MTKPMLNVNQRHHTNVNDAATNATNANATNVYIPPPYTNAKCYYYQMITMMPQPLQLTND